MCDSHNTTRCPKCGFGTPERKSDRTPEKKCDRTPEKKCDRTPENLSPLHSPPVVKEETWTGPEENLPFWAQDKIKRLPAWARKSMNASAASCDLNETPKSSKSAPQVKEITITEISIKGVDLPKRLPREGSKWTVKPITYEVPPADCTESPETFCDLKLEGVMSEQELEERNMQASFSCRPDLQGFFSCRPEYSVLHGSRWGRTPTSDKNKLPSAAWAPKEPACDIDDELECEEEEDDFNETIQAASDCEDDLDRTLTPECPKPACQPAQESECEEEEEFDPWDVTIAPLWAKMNQSQAAKCQTPSPKKVQGACSSPSRGSPKRVLNSTFTCDDANDTFGKISNVSGIGASSRGSPCRKSVAQTPPSAGRRVSSRGSPCRKSVAQTTPSAGRRVGPSTLGGMFSRPAPAECRNLPFRLPPKPRAPCANGTITGDGKSNQPRRVTQSAPRAVLYQGEVLPPPIFETVRKGQKSFTKFRKEMNPLATCRPGGKIPPNKRGQPEFVPIADDTNVKMLPLDKCASFTKCAKKQPCAKAKPRCQPAMNQDPFNTAFCAQVPRDTKWHSFEARPDCRRKRRLSS